VSDYRIDENGNRVLTTDDEIRELLRNDALRAAGIGSDSASPPSNVVTGSARNVTNQTDTPATFSPDKVNEIKQDPTKTGTDSLSAGKSSSPNGPPFENVLERFASFSVLWTLCCLEPNQYNNPASYRGNDSVLSNVILSSAGRFDGQRVVTAFGTPEYFIDNVNFNSLVSPRAATGNTNVMTFTFEVLEPYSMGLFLQSLQVAAVNCGYRNYLEMAPFLLKLDFLGSTDDGNIVPRIDNLSKYFTIKITNVTMRVDEAGSRYVVSAVPFHHLGFGDTNNILKADVKLVGGSVQEVLSTGTVSLVSRLNTEQQQLVNNKKQALPDIYEIVFPSSASDDLGVSSSTSFSIFGATINPGTSSTNITSLLSSAKNVTSLAQTATGVITKSKSVASALSGVSTGSSSSGGNKIGSSTMNFSIASGGNIAFTNENKAINDKTGTTDRTKVTIDPNTREFNFSIGDRVTQVIQKVILVSNYASDAIKVENLDDKGLADWFRVDVQIQLLDYDAIRSTRAKKFVYRVVPYKVNGSVIKAPNAATPGIPELSKIIAKRYDYIFTGQNNSILKFELEFNGMFFTGAQPRPMHQTGTNNPDTQNTTDTGKVEAPVNQGSNTATGSSTVGSTMVGPDANTVKNSPIGWKTVEQQIADAYQNAFLSASPDLVNLEIDIVGDPYFLSDSGVNSNYFSKTGINLQITADQSMNYEGSQIFVYLAFRTPINPNTEPTDTNSGLYNFAKDGISPFSGIFRILSVTNIFSGGNYTQNMKLARVLGQPNDFVGLESIQIQNLLLYAASIPIPPSSTPASDQRSRSEVDSTFVETPAETERLLAGVDRANAAAQQNQRPSSQAASSSGVDLSLVDPRLIQAFKKDDAEIARDQRRQANLNWLASGRN